LGFSPDRFSGKMLKTLTDTQVEHALELMLTLYRAIRYSVNQRFDLDLCLSKLASLRDFLTSKEILREMQELREGLSAGAADGNGGAAEQVSSGPGAQVSPTPGVHEGNAAAAAGSAAASPERGMIGAPEAGDDASAYHEDDHQITPPPAQGLRPEQAADIIRRIRPTRLALSSALEKAVRWALAESELSIIFDSEYPANAARGEEEVIRNAAADVLGKPVLVRIKVDADVSQDEVIDEDHDAQVDMVKKVFRGEIVDGQA
ncbi:MAG: hypothetical protein ACOC1U_11280, partial [Spirochaetota bacterium]